MNQKTAFVVITVATFSTTYFGARVQAAQNRPNILWLSAEDISAHLGCYADPHAITPYLNTLAMEGV